MKISLEDVSVRFGETEALSHLTVTLSERRIGVIGDNGSGKSTFARLLNGLTLPTSGRVSVGGWDTRDQGAEVRRLVGFMFQNSDSQIVMPTVAEDVALGLKARRLPEAQVSEASEQALIRSGIAHLRDRASFTLSGGEK